jgi:hypothetical protein
MGGVIPHLKKEPDKFAKRFLVYRIPDDGESPETHWILRES